MGERGQGRKGMGHNRHNRADKIQRLQIIAEDITYWILTYNQTILGQSTAHTENDIKTKNHQRNIIFCD